MTGFEWWRGPVSALVFAGIMLALGLLTLAAPSEITLHGVIFWSQKANPKDGGEHLFISWPELQRYEILRPRGTWQACKKEVAK